MNDQNQPSTPHRHDTRSLVSRLMRECVRPYLGKMGIAVFFMVVMAAATAMSAWLMEPIVNDVFVKRNAEILWLVGGAVMATFAIKGGANYAQATMMSWIGLRIIADSQNRLYAHLSNMDLSFFHNVPSGQLVSRFIIDINQMRVAVSNALTGVGKDLMSLIGLLGVMFMQDFELALIAFVVFPIAIYPIARLGKRIRKVTVNTQQEMGLFTALLGQTFQGIRVVKAYGMQDYEKGRIATLIENIFKLNFKSSRTRALSSPIMETLGGVAVAIVIVYGGYRVIGEQTDAGSFFSFITALLMAYEPMKRLANLNASLQEGLAGAQRMFDVLDTQPGITERDDASELSIPHGGVTLKDVRFAYDPEQPALNGIDIEAPAGKTIALVGPSGAGKSTILNLIPRFYDVDSGDVLIDGTNVQDVTFASLWQGIALVSQEITLFDDTIRANIAYGKAGASDDEIIEAAKHAAAHDFISEMPNGYDTLVGELGVKLSGGQRQRLAIARAMLKNAPILLLDEATSALDTESERQVQSALQELMKGRTTLVIAHRLSTIADADIIYVIDGGRVAESGTHEKLITDNGLYARLHALQFNDASVEPASTGTASTGTASTGTASAEPSV